MGKVEKPMNDKVARPRNDMVLIRIVDLGMTKGGLATPNIGTQGKEYHVIAFGPKVEDLRVGDKVQVTGKKGVDWDLLPKSTDTFITKQDNVLIVEGNVEDDE
jgi:hypothetical protein